MIYTSGYLQFRDRFLRRMAAVGTDVTLSWVTLANVTTDAETGARLGTPTIHTSTVKGYVHFPDIATRQVVQFAEIEAGDCIVELPPDTTIEGLEQLAFTINGEVWTQKKIGIQLAKAWDTVFENARFCRTLLLRKAT
jgi:hypothetical protein